MNSTETDKSTTPIPPPASITREPFPGADLDEVRFWIDLLRADHPQPQEERRVVASPGAPWRIK